MQLQGDVLSPRKSLNLKVFGKNGVDIYINRSSNWNVSF